jgi:site-specific DNA recombinase
VIKAAGTSADNTGPSLNTMNLNRRLTMSETNSIRGVLYCRFSTDQQGGSVEQQQRWAREVAPKAGVEVVAEFADEGKRGYDFAGRNGLKAMIDFLGEEKRLGRPVRVIVLWDTSRLSRSDSLETAHHLHLIRERGVEALFTTSGWAYLNRTTDRVLLNLSQDLTNEAYSKSQAKNSARGRLANVQDRLWNGAIPPYGYLRVFETPDQKRKRPRLVPGGPQEVETVRWIFSAYASGDWGLRAIAADLNRRNVPTPYQWRRPDRNLKWTPTTVRSVLTNPVYVGTVRWGCKRRGRFAVVFNGQVKEVAEVEDQVRRGEAREGACKGKAAPGEWQEQTNCHEPLVSVEVFEKAQLMLGERKKRTAPHKTDKFVFSSMLRCAACGRGMVGRVQGGEKVYLCGTYLDGGRHACAYKVVREAPLLEAIAGKIREAFLSPQGRQALEKTLRDRLAGGPRVGADRDELKRQVAALERKASAVARKLAVEEDSDLEQEFRSEWQQVTEEKKRLDAKLDELDRLQSGRKDVDSQVAAALDLMKEFVNLVKTAEPARVRKVLRGLISHIETFWGTEQRGSRRLGTFERGVVYLKKGVLPSWLMSGSGGNFFGKRPAWPAARRRGRGSLRSVITLAARSSFDFF